MDRETYQCLTTSEDGITFQKHRPVKRKEM